MLQLFRKVTTAHRLDKQILHTEEALIHNAHNAEHYAALAQANRKQLTVLRGMQKVGTSIDLSEAAKPVAAAKTSPRLAASK